MSTSLSDIKFILRQLRKHPFTNGVIVLTIAMLIAAVSVLYASLVGVREARAPFPESDRLVKLWRTGERITDLFPGEHYAEYAERLTNLSELGALRRIDPKTLTQDGETKTHEVRSVSVNLLTLAGIPPLKGRLFNQDDLNTEGERPIILSEQLWRGRLVADANIIGRPLLLSDEWHLVVGVMPASIHTTHLANNIDIWTPTRFREEAQGLVLFGRLKPGVSLTQAKAEMTVLARLLEESGLQHKLGKPAGSSGFRGGVIVPIDKSLYSGSNLQLMGVLFGTVIIACVVGISCFNVTNLLLARVSARSYELAIRSAMGARRSHIVRLVLSESLLLSAFGGVVGLLLSWWIIDSLRWADIVPARFDARLYLVATGAVVLLGLLVGLLPAFGSVRGDLTRALKEGRRSTGRKRRYRLRDFLVSSEVTMALILCVVAGLMVRVYIRLHSGDLGFQPDRIFALKLTLRDDLYPEDSHKQFYVARAMQALAEAPGVESVAVMGSWRQVGSAFSSRMTLAATGGREEMELSAGLHYGSERLPAMYGMTLLRGRRLSPDAASAGQEVIVSESFVRKHLSELDPIGRQLSVGYTPPDQAREWKTIVGVVRDRHPLTSPRPIGPEVFLDYRESSSAKSFTLLTRTRADAKAVAKTLREFIQRLDFAQPVGQPVFMGDLLELNATGPREAMILLGALGSVGLFIALMGVYSVVAFCVQERTHEIGVRMAVGASGRDVLMLVIWQGLRLVTFGVAPGLLIGSLITMGLLQETGRVGLSLFDPITYVIAVCVLACASIAATFFPAWRAATLKPMEALRYE